MAANRTSPWLSVLLILSAEAIFALPFHVARFFRPTLLAVFELSHTQLGALQSAYGLVAMLAYFPGGMLADRFSPRVLLPGALLSTAAGGVYFATLPPSGGLLALHLFWGLTTILLFWGALIRATRESSNENHQGRAFGVLDGGRGLLAAGLASLGVLFLGLEGHDSLTPEQRASALQKIIATYTAVTAALGTAAYLLLPSVPGGSGKSPTLRAALLPRAFDWLRQPSFVWHSLIVLCAYCAYKGVDFYSVFAVEVHRMSERDAAALSTLSVWVRPFAALGAGLIADRVPASRLVFYSFVGLFGIYVPLGLSPRQFGPPVILIMMVLSTSVLVYAFRSLYFVLLGERAVPKDGTGTAVGIVSFLGYSPDFFFPALSGVILDGSPGAEGYGNFFLMLAGWALLGALAAHWLRRGVVSVSVASASVPVEAAAAVRDS